MTSYYNEIDKHAAAWLRELVKAGHIADGIVDERDIQDVLPSDLAGFTQCHFFATSAQDQMAGSSFDQEACGMLDKEPKPFQATSCLQQNDAAQGAHTLGGVQFQSLDLLRKIRSTSVHLGSIGKTACSENRLAFSPLFWRDKSPPFLADAHGNFALSRRYFFFCIRPNKSTCCVARGRFGIRHHTPCSDVQGVLAEVGSFFANVLCSVLSSIFCANGRQAFLCRIRRNEVASFPYQLHLLIQ